MLTIRRRTRHVRAGHLPGAVTPGPDVRDAEVSLQLRAIAIDLSTIIVLRDFLRSGHAADVLLSATPWGGTPPITAGSGSVSGISAGGIATSGAERLASGCICLRNLA